MAYKKGDHVRYGTNGVCVVADIETMTSMDRRSIKDYYVLRPVADSGTKIFVPLDNPALLGKMHAILTPPEIDEALPLLQLCCCIHARRLHLSQEGKRLSGSDETILKQAERLVENEFAFSLNIPRAEVGAYIHHLWQESAGP